MTDVKSTVDGDLDLTHGLTTATRRERDRALIVTRAMTVRGECAFLPALGLTDNFLGKSITADLIRQVENAVLSAVMGDLGLAGARLTVRAVPVSLDTLAVFIECARNYEDGDSQTVIIGDWWHRNEAITLLDGSIEVEED